MENWDNDACPGRGQLLTDDEEPPPTIDLLAENYRLRLTARLAARSEPGPCPIAHPLVPILVGDAQRPRQTDRFVHFLPFGNEAVPANAHVFDFDGAMGEYNERQYEYQRYVIDEAMRRCVPRPSKPRMRSGSAQRASPRLSYERQPPRAKPAGITLPTKRVPPPKKRAAPGKPTLGESITISRVALPDQKRPRPCRQGARDFAAPQRSARMEITRVDGNRTDGRSTPRRYRSPPPKPPERMRAAVPCARGDYSAQVHQLGDLVGE
jgi:hypothetical protein